MYRHFLRPPACKVQTRFFLHLPSLRKLSAPRFLQQSACRGYPSHPLCTLVPACPPSAAHLCLHGWPTPGTPANLWMRGPLAGAGCCPLGCAGLNLPPCPSLDFSEDDRTTRQGLGLATRCAIPQQFLLTGELVVEGCAINCSIQVPGPQLFAVHAFSMAAVLGRLVDLACQDI